MNASVRLLHDCPGCRIIRVYPDGVKSRFLPGQYGSLGLESDRAAGKYVKRAYSVSSPLLDEGGTLVDVNESPYYEFFFNLIEAPENGRERLTPKLFRLKDGDRIFCGSKFSGHYTAQRVPRDKNVLLVATTTGEAANNALLGTLLAENRAGRVCFIVAGPQGWLSPYRATHKRLQEGFKKYRHIEAAGPDYSRLERLVFDEKEIGFPLSPADCHVFLCGDPAMIGAPEKLGAWNYRERQGGLVRTLTAAGFELGTRFKEGNIEHENYW